MNHPYLFIFGISVFGFLLPEFLLVLSRGSRASVPLGMNFLSSIAAALIAAAFVL